MSCHVKTLIGRNQFCNHQNHQIVSVHVNAIINFDEIFSKRIWLISKVILLWEWIKFVHLILRSAYINSPNLYIGTLDGIQHFLLNGTFFHSFFHSRTHSQYWIQLKVNVKCTQHTPGTPSKPGSPGIPSRPSKPK